VRHGTCFRRRLSPTVQVPRRTPRSLSLGSLGHSTHLLMNPRKKEIKDIILRIIAEQSDEPVRSFNHLKTRLTEILHPQDEQAKASALIEASVFGGSPSEPQLSDDDWAFFSEAYWDLVIERAITPGLNSSNPEFRWFRIHSESPYQRKESV